MPLVINQPKPEFKPVDLAAPVAPPAPVGLTRADVDAMLAERDAQWRAALVALRSELLAAVAANKPAPRTGATIKFTKDFQGVIESAQIIPNKASQP